MRNRIYLIALVGVVAYGVIGLAAAQQLNQPKQVEPFKPVSSAESTSASSNVLPAPQQRVKSGVRASASDRATPAPMSAKGPANDAARPGQPSSITPKAPVKPLRVTDAQGRVVAGAVMVGDNRVMDPRTGRVYSTVPDGDGQRIIQPTKP